jgi:hypothetical protein
MVDLGFVAKGRSGEWLKNTATARKSPNGGPVVAF